MSDYTDKPEKIRYIDGPGQVIHDLKELYNEGLVTAITGVAFLKDNKFKPFWSKGILPFDAIATLEILKQDLIDETIEERVVEPIGEDE